MSHTYSKHNINKPSIPLRIYCFIFRKQIIKLVSYPTIGKSYFSYIKKGCYCGRLHSSIFWSSNVGDVILNEDGTISKDSESNYIERWEVY
jgi:hypothetical protein